MINGEGSRETSSELASVDPLDEHVPWQSQKSDSCNGSPVSSRYSSCGESEFDRYCSANSVMGTPSFCSSMGTFQECFDSEFGSVKSFDSGLENFSLGGRSNRKSEVRKLSSSGGLGCLESTGPRNNLELGQGSIGMKDGLNSSENGVRSWLHEDNYGDSDHTMPLKDVCGSESRRVVDFNTAFDDGLFSEDDGGGVVRWRDPGESRVMQNSALNPYTSVASDVELQEETHSQVIMEKLDLDTNELHSHSNVEHISEAGGCSDGDKTLSTYEHSDGEESMFGNATDEDQRIDSYHQKKNIQYHQELKNENKNPLVMNSSVAFGSDDWDDFMHETEETDITSLTLDKFQEKKQLETETQRNLLISTSETDIGFPSVGESGQVVRDISVASNHVQGADELSECIKTCSVSPIGFPDFSDAEQGEDVKDVIVTSNQVRCVDDSVGDFQISSVGDILENQLDPLSQEAPWKNGLNLMGSSLDMGHPFASTELLIRTDDSRESEISKSQFDPRSVTSTTQLFSASNEAPEEKLVDFLKDPYSSPAMADNNIKSTLNDSHASFNLVEDHPKSIKMESLELNEFYDELVHEMEEILLDSGESPGATFSPANRIHQSQVPLPLRDGGPTASTSGTDYTYLPIHRLLRIDGVEVVGAKQKKGDVSLGERLVGVKEYTVYNLKVWSGNDDWEVERRYRDFCTLYRRLKSLSADQGWSLPSPWSSVERESRKIFGNVSPDVVAERSSLIQDCLRSILFRFPSGPPNALIWFLSPQTVPASSPTSNTLHSQFPLSSRERDTGNLSMLGKTISLVLEIRPQKTTRQILESQHYTCAGCHKHFDDGKTRMWEFVQTLGWGKPRLCEYTSQFFCSLCHTNEISVLPARVLHHWDFTQYPVSQLAKSYLDSIRDQPMLCVSAVNPFLFSKVPALQHVTGVRKSIGATLPYVRCPFRRSIYERLGSRRYLLESNDFFALRDLIDLSKGAFAALPVMVETVSRRILEHITEQCLICCDVGVPCNARRACDDPSSLIFPFQEGEIERCRSCKSVFHKCCFKKIASCHCTVNHKLDEVKVGTSMIHGSEVEGTSDLFGWKPDSKSSVGFLSGLFSKAKQENTLGRKDSDTVILMGSLPGTSL